MLVPAAAHPQTVGQNGQSSGFVVRPIPGVTPSLSASAVPPPAAQPRAPGLLGVPAAHLARTRNRFRRPPPPLNASQAVAPAPGPPPPLPRDVGDQCLDGSVAGQHGPRRHVPAIGRDGHAADPGSSC